MRWPWTQPPLETRADSSYTDALVQAILSRSQGKQTAYPSAIGALEAASGMIARAFASAEVTASPAIQAALSPATMSLVGRSLTRRGELVLYISTDGGRLELLPCASHDVDGGPMPSSWRYRCTIGGPDRTHTFEDVPATGVIHLCWGRDPETPWRGIGPLQAAGLTGKLAAEVLAALADESTMPRGALLGIPTDGDDDTVQALKSDIRKLAGQVALMEVGDYGGAAGGGQATGRINRVGPDPGAAQVELFRLSREDVISACGINPSLFMDAQGTAQRESFRQFLFATVAPIGRTIAAELSEKLEDTVKLDWAELRASDIQGRARAFQSMVGGGKDVGEAAACRVDDQCRLAVGNVSTSFTVTGFAHVAGLTCISRPGLHHRAGCQRADTRPLRLV